MMRDFELAGFSLKQLEVINKPRLAQQLVFLSDVLEVNGKTVQ